MDTQTNQDKIFVFKYNDNFFFSTADTICTVKKFIQIFLPNNSENLTIRFNNQYMNFNDTNINAHFQSYMTPVDVDTNLKEKLKKDLDTIWVKTNKDILSKNDKSLILNKYNDFDTTDTTFIQLKKKNPSNELSTKRYFEIFGRFPKFPISDNLDPKTYTSISFPNNQSNVKTAKKYGLGMQLKFQNMHIFRFGDVSPHRYYYFTGDTQCTMQDIFNFYNKVNNITGTVIQPRFITFYKKHSMNNNQSNTMSYQVNADKYIEMSTNITTSISSKDQFNSQHVLPELLNAPNTLYTLIYFTDTRPTGPIDYLPIMYFFKFNNNTNLYYSVNYEDHTIKQICESYAQATKSDMPGTSIKTELFTPYIDNNNKVIYTNSKNIIHDASNTKKSYLMGTDFLWFESHYFENTIATDSATLHLSPELKKNIPKNKDPHISYTHITFNISIGGMVLNDLYKRNEQDFRLLEATARDTVFFFKFKDLTEYYYLTADTVCTMTKFKDFCAKILNNNDDIKTIIFRHNIRTYQDLGQTYEIHRTRTYHNSLYYYYNLQKTQPFIKLDINSNAYNNDYINSSDYVEYTNTSSGEKSNMHQFKYAMGQQRRIMTRGLPIPEYTDICESTRDVTQMPKLDILPQNYSYTEITFEYIKPYTFDLLYANNTFKKSNGNEYVKDTCFTQINNIKTFTNDDYKIRQAQQNRIVYDNNNKQYENMTINQLYDSIKDIYSRFSSNYVCYINNYHFINTILKNDWDYTITDYLNPNGQNQVYFDVDVAKRLFEYDKWAKKMLPNRSYFE